MERQVGAKALKISVLGAGNIGGTLGSKWAAAGHEVVFGVRDPQAEKVLARLAEAAHGTMAVPLPTSVAGAEVVVFAIPGRAVTEAIAQLGNGLEGKILIDATNNVGQEPMHNLELLRAVAPESRTFRAFSTLGWENFAEPVIDGLQVDLFYCGGDGEEREVVHGLIGDIGLRPVYLGGLEQADLVDALTRLWFLLALRQGRGRRLAFKLLGGDR